MKCDKMVLRIKAICTQSATWAIKKVFLIIHSSHNLILSRRFNSIECTADNFTWLFEGYYGNCFKFNAATGQDKISLPGKFNGLN